jgi:hypothetical protein
MLNCQIALAGSPKLQPFRLRSFEGETYVRRRGLFGHVSAKVIRSNPIRRRYDRFPQDSGFDDARIFSRIQKSCAVYAAPTGPHVTLSLQRFTFFWDSVCTASQPGQAGTLGTYECHTTFMIYDSYNFDIAGYSSIFDVFGSSFNITASGTQDQAGVLHPGVVQPF